MGDFVMRGCLAFIIILIFISISVCGCLDNGEVAITTPADEMILTESDFDNNWTSWWTSTEVEDEIEPPIIDHSFVRLRHYTSYPIEEWDRDLEMWIIINVFNSTVEADNFMKNLSEFFTQSFDLTDIDIGDDNFQYQDGNDTFTFFRVKNAVVAMFFFHGPDGEKPDESRIIELIHLQESRIE